MSDPAPALPTVPTQAPWTAWALGQLQIGVAVLDEQLCVAFINPWLVQHARLQPAQAVPGTPFFDLFASLRGSYFERTLQQVLRSGFPAMLSQTLHPSPLPLFALNAQRGQDKRLRQSVRLLAMGPQEVARAGQRYVLIQVADVTPTVLRERILKAQAAKAHGMASLDALTGLGNRRLIDELLPQELQQAQRTQRPLALLMFDIDEFKQYNDCYGHPAGDECLRQVAACLREVCKRPRDCVARYGGEELMAILPDTDEQGGASVALHMLQRVRDARIAHARSRVAPWVTLSAGLAVTEVPRMVDAATLIDQADRALYAAKSSGRDRTFRFDAPTDQALPLKP